MKTVLILTLLGALLGIAAASFIVPPALSWYNEAGYLGAPGGAQGSQPQALVNVPNLMRYTTDRLIRGQAIGGAIGAVLFLVLGIVLARRPSRRAAATASSASAASAATSAAAVPPPASRPPGAS
jgi:hypothetical protein